MKLLSNTVIVSTYLACYAFAIHESSSENHAEVVLGVKNTNRCNCVILILPESLSCLKIKTLARILGARNIFTLVSEITQLGKVLAEQRTLCSHPLVVIDEELEDRKELFKVLRHVGYSLPTWLFFLQDDEHPESVLQDVDIAFDCKLLMAHFEQGQEVSITEAYRVAPHLPLQQHAFGSWSRQAGFTGPGLELHSRRNNLQGVALKVAAFNDPPLTIFSSNQPNVLDGFYGIIWQTIATKVNFTMQVIPPVTGYYGLRDANGSWDGFMGQMQRHEVDVVAAAVTISTKRLGVPRFSHPLYPIEYKIFIREPDRFEVSWASILSPFSPGLWATVLITASAASIFLSQLYKCDHRYHNQIDRQIVSLHDSAFFVFGAIFCQQNHNQNPRSLACCVTYMVVYLCGMIVISSYSAMLISMLTIFIPKMPFTDFEGLLADTSYLIGAQKDVAVITYFQESRDPLLQAIYARKISQGLSTAAVSQTEGFQRVCDQNYAHIGAIRLLPVMRNTVTCLLFPLPTAVSKVYGGYGMYPKNSTYAGVLDHIVLNMFQSGIIQRMSRPGKYRFQPLRVQSFRSVSFEAITPFLSIVLGGVLFGSALVLLENFVFWLGKEQHGSLNGTNNRVIRNSE